MRDRGIPFRRTGGGPAAPGPGEARASVFCRPDHGVHRGLCTLGHNMGAEHFRRACTCRYRPRIASVSDLVRAVRREGNGRQASCGGAGHLRPVGARGEIGVGAGPHRWVSRERLCELLDELLLDTNDERSGCLPPGPHWERSSKSSQAAFGADLSAVLIEKTPLHLYYSKTILEWWSAARVVELIRDGRDVCVSLQHKAEGGRWAPADRRDQINRWVQAVGFGAAAERTTAGPGTMASDLL